MEKINIMGVPFDSCTLGEAVEFCRGLPRKKVAPHAELEIVRLCIKQPEYYDITNDAALIIPDGRALCWRRRYGAACKGKVAG